MSHLPGLKITSEIIKKVINTNKTQQLLKFSTSRIIEQSCRGPQGKCGIPPIAKKEIIKKEKVVLELPRELQAPPCIPRGKQNTKFPPLCATNEGIICPQDVLKYKYPAYSECRRRASRERYQKECCYYPPPPCEIHLVRDENTK